ncbi:MAG: aminotransferase class III-fold pyridoxal phosphate-dependent enzyme, partial [Pseudomonadota bacterium]
LNGIDGSHSTFLEAWGGGVIRSPYPYSDQLPAGLTEERYVEYCLWYLDNHIPATTAARDNIAAVLIEPGLAEGGNWIPATSFLRGVRDVCDRNGWLMVVDEVLTGVGRTGRMWGIEHYDIVPDVLVYGKNLSGGVAPLCGISARDEIMADSPDFLSGSTFAGSPAGCAAAIKTLQILHRDRIVDKAARLGDIASETMEKWRKYSCVRQIRNNGLLLGVAFRKPSDSDERERDWWTARAVRGQMLENGVWAISDHEDTIRLYPALNMHESVLREGLEIMEAAIRHVDRHGHDEGDSSAYPTGVAGF